MSAMMFTSYMKSLNEVIRGADSCGYPYADDNPFYLSLPFDLIDAAEALNMIIANSKETEAEIQVYYPYNNCREVG